MIDWTQPARATLSAMLKVQTTPKDSLLAITGKPKEQSFPIELNVFDDPLGLKAYTIVNNEDDTAYAEPFKIIDI